MASSLLMKWLMSSTAGSGLSMVEEMDHRLAAFIHRLGFSATYGGRLMESSLSINRAKAM